MTRRADIAAALPIVFGLGRIEAAARSLAEAGCSAQECGGNQSKQESVWRSIRSACSDTRLAGDRMMPIKAENRARYPKDWPAISQAIRDRAKHCCEFCGVPHNELGGRSPNGTWHKATPKGEKLLRLEWPQPGEEWLCVGYDKPLRIVRIILTVAHLDHTPENCAPENLKALCQRCHNRYDQPHRRKNAAATIRSKKASGDLFPTPTQSDRREE